MHENLQSKPDNVKRYALITGASQGFGKELAEELARRGHNLLLVSLPNENLDKVSNELALKYNIDAKYFESDLTKERSVYDIAEWALLQYRVNVLINNAGIGGSMPFQLCTTKMLDEMILINIRAVTILTRLMIEELRSHPKSYILNVGSLASFSPMAFKSVYPPSKAFIYSFSHGLNQELKGSGVSVTAIHPGPMKTNAEVTSRIERQSFLGRLGLLSPKRVAKQAINGLFKSKTQIVPGIYNRIFWLLLKITPLNIRLSLVSDVFRLEASKTHNGGKPVSSNQR